MLNKRDLINKSLNARLKLRFELISLRNNSNAVNTDRSKTLTHTHPQLKQEHAHTDDGANVSANDSEGI